ncbi:hypothetical protein [Luteibacter sp. E-22]|uniref:hypothetical protein n=1 Tax=Luteibacter sp. E-22 TaxID=3404050 RepID=UPI003CF51816
MKFSILRIVTACVIGIVPSLAWAQLPGEKPIRLSADLDLTASQQKQLETEALKGSPEAARKLATFHFIVRGDRDATLRWYTIGAENGDASCQFSLYDLLESDPNTALRAHFWLQKSADAGFPYAKNELKRLKDRASH